MRAESIASTLADGQRGIVQGTASEAAGIDHGVACQGLLHGPHARRMV